MLHRSEVDTEEHVPLRHTIYADLAKCAACGRHLVYGLGQWLHLHTTEEDMREFTDKANS